MKRKHLLLTLLLALFAPWAANAQVMMLFSQDFEGGTMPLGWTQEQVNGDASWSVGTGDYETSTGAGEGTYNAQIQTNYRGYSTRLITPVIDLSFVAGAELSFMHIERPWGADMVGYPEHPRR